MIVGTLRRALLIAMIGIVAPAAIATPKMALVMLEIRSRDLVFVDSRTTPPTVALDVAIAERRGHVVLSRIRTMRASTFWRVRR